MLLMLGVLITLAFTIGAIGVGAYLAGRWTSDLDPAESIGVHGLIGLGAIGLLTLFIGLIPGGLQWGLMVVGVLSLFGLTRLAPAFKEGQFKFAKPEGANLLFVLAIAVGGLFALVSVLAPSDMLDWDTLAYHLADPKVWLQSGQIQYLYYEHHSNFPCTVDNLFIWGLTWGGAAGAKAFSLAFLLLGVLAIFGFARRRYGAVAAWWSALAFATIPVVLWEAGTGYIDVPHGLYGGLGAVYAANYLLDQSKRSNLWLSGLMLGFAAGTKYTGLQTIGVVLFVIVCAMAMRKQVSEGFRSAALIGLVAAGVGGSWYVKNIAWTGNPVYPFFFEKLGGHDWDQRRADAYRIEQQKFGAGPLAERHRPAQFGAAVLGLAYQPGRYVNPGEDQGQGTPLGATGIVVVAAALIWAISGAAGLFEGVLLSMVGVSFLIWFFLSQQSRYVVPLAVPLTILAGAAIPKLKAGRLVMVAISLQAAYSLYLVYTQRFQLQSQVALGKVSPEDYQSQMVSFYKPSLVINKEVKGGKVALYDEVFGYLLDVPYAWANPPHDTVIPYDSMKDAASYVAGMKKLGFTHLYLNMSPLVKDQDFAKRWIASMGLQGAPVPLPEAEYKAMMQDPIRWQDKWEALVSDAAAQHLITPVQGTNHWLLFKIP